MASLRLFCFPFSGGGASVYRSWPEAMGSDIEVRSVQLPGRESRYHEVRETNIAVLVQDIVKEMKPYQDKPFALFGYSLGALLVFEVCRELRRHGMHMPVHIFVAAMRAPQMQSVHPPLSPLPDDQFLEKIEYYYQPNNEAWKHAELREIFLPVLKDDIALSDNYTYTDEAALSCPIEVFSGSDDIGAPPDLIERWADQSSSRMRLHSFQGGHFFIDEYLKDIQEIVLCTLKTDNPSNV